MPKLLVLLALVHSAAAFAVSPIRDICKDANTEPLRKAETLQDAGQAVCRLAAHHSTDQEILKLAGHVQGVIQKLQEEKKSAKNWQNNSDLQLAYAGLVDRINAKIKPETVDPKNPLRNALLSLMNRFSSREEREKTPANYRFQIEEVIRLTRKGPALLNCFRQELPSKLRPGRYEPAPAANQDMMGFKIEPGQDPEYKFDRVITFNNTFHPLLAVMSLAHELQHSCFAEKARECLSSGPPEKISDDCRQSFAIDELRAYKLESEFFAEIAAQIPSLACGFSYVSPAFGNVPVRSADAEASNQEAIESGDFLQRLIPNYVSKGTYKSADIFYEKAKPGQPLKLRQDFRNKIEAAGFTAK